MLIEEIVRINCELLQISIPSIKINPAESFPTKTMRAAIVWDGVNAEEAELFLNEDFMKVFASDSFQLWIVISHELRHLWQIRRGGIIGLSYQTSDKLEQGDYNEQELEVDAWAWVCVVLQRKFGMRPDFETLFGAELANKIVERAKIIREDLKK